MLRALPVIRHDPLRFLDACAQRHGPVVQFPVPGAPVYYVSDPVAVRRLLQTNHPAYGRQTLQYEALSRVTGTGLLVSEGEQWRTVRRMLQPAFQRDLHDGVESAVASATEDLLQRWTALAPSSEVDVEQAMLRTTLLVVGEMLLGSDLDAEATSLISAVGSALDVVVRRAGNPLLRALPTSPGSSRRLASSVHAVDSAVDRVVAARRKSRGPDDDALGLLIRACDAGRITRRQVRDEVVTLVVAGHETVAAAVTWSVALLARQPTWCDRLRDDDAVAAAVVKESLRLYPPAWLISRRAVADGELADVPVPAGATVFCSPFTLHRDGRQWADPLAFRPERFLSGDERTFAGYLPFGAGPRLCIGRELALLEIRIILQRLLSAVDVTAVCAMAQPDLGVTVRPRGGLRVGVVPRTRSMR